MLFFVYTRSFADPLTWTDGTVNGDWDTSGNWYDPYNASHVPTGGDVVYVTAPEHGNLVTFADANNPLTNLIFQNSGNNYTFGSAGGSNGLYFEYGTGIFMEANLIGSDGGETFNAPIESPGSLFLSNFSPTANVESQVAGVNGYDNTLTIAGSLQVDNNNVLYVIGDGNVNITGNITGTTHFYQDSDATTTFSGNNNYTGWTIVAGTLVLDNTVNNSDKLSEGIEGKDPALVLGENGNGGHLVINGNEAGTAEVLGGLDASNNDAPYSGHLDIRGGTNSVVLNGSTDGGGATTLAMGTLVGGFGTTIDLTANGNAAFYTTSTNNGQYGAQINLLGQYVTYDKTYWAQASTTSASQGPNAGETLITPLTVDNGDGFNSQWNNYTVDAGGQTLNSALNVAQAREYDVANPHSQQFDTFEGADTIRFTSAGTLDLGKGSTYTDNTGTYTGDGFLYMVYGGIMVAQGVTGDTAITNGTLLNNRDLFGMDFLNYGSGTLTVAASLAEASGTYQQGNDRTDTFSFGGGGEIILAGDNSTIAPGSTLDINSGLVQITNNNALGIDNRIVMGDNTSVLDLNGNSVHIGYLSSDGNMMPGNEAAAAGLNTRIENTAAGTISRLTIEGYSQPQASNSDGNVGVGFVDQDVNLGGYYGGLNEVSGSIISLDLEQGTATTEVQFDLGTADPYGDPNLVNVTDATQNAGPATSITGAIIIGANANLGLQNYGNVTTLGVTKLDGEIGAAGQQAAYYATTYLTGTGAVVSGYGGWGFDLNPVGSAADTFAGHFGQSNDNGSMQLITSGTGAINFANEIYNNGVYTEGTTTLTTPGIGYNQVFVGGASTLNITGSSGTVLGTGALDLYGGTLNIAPASPGPNVVVSGGETAFQVSGAGTLILNNGGGNNSLTLQMGNTSSGFTLNNWSESEFSIGSVQGLSSLGTTDRVVALSSNGGTIPLQYYGGPEPLPGGILGPGDYAQNDALGSSRNATFLTYSGTGAATDAGFEGYTFAAANTDNLNNTGTAYSMNLIDTNYTLSAGLGYDQILGLEIDNSATLNVTGNIEVGSDGLGFGSIILNGGHITGNGVSISRVTDIYTSLDNGYISSLSEDYGGQDVVKNGPGTLFIGALNGFGNIVINNGTLDAPAINSEGWGDIVLNGGVLQTNGSYELELGGGHGELNWGQGGFSARGGQLTLTILDSTGSANLVWGGTGDFLGQGAVMQFGSTTADNQIDFQSNINLGEVASGYTGQQAVYSRVIDVTANSSDSGDPLLYQDYAFIYGNISSSNPYVGLAKTGNGVLVLFGDNTYTGATTIAEGTLAINADNSLGTAPTAAYALNTTPGLNGGALTPGAVEISGGASLAVENGYSVQSYYANDVVLNSNRQILLAGGTTGQTASIINVQGDPVYGYSELDFGGLIADYVGEVGSLEKAGGGLFNYSGTSSNTGADSVVAGTFEVSGSGSVNSTTGVTINNQTPTSGATFNYQSTVGLSKAVTYGAGGGTFAYNSGALYTGSTSLVVGAKDTLAGGVGGLGNLSQTDVTIGTGGTILPGSQDPSPGQLTVGKLSLLQGGNYNFLMQNAQLAGFGPDPQFDPVGPGYSTVVATSLDLSGLSSSNPFDINLESLSAPLGQAADRFYFYLPYTFTLVSTTDGITGAFNAADFDVITMPNNGTTGFDNSNGGEWTVAESSNGDNLLLEYTPTEAPEPSTWVMMLGGLGLLGFCVRRARRHSA
jgi:autotransporter-associated beta strand protein